MALDDDLQRAIETVTTRLRDELARLANDVSESALATRDEAVRAAVKESELQAEERLDAALAAAKARALEHADEENHRHRSEGRLEGIEEGRAEGIAQARAEVHAEAHAEGRAAGLAEGREAGLVEGREEGQQETGKAIAATRAAISAELGAAHQAATGRLVEAMAELDRGRSLTDVLDTLVACAAAEASRAALVLIREGRYQGWRFVGFGTALGAAEKIEFGTDEAGVIGDAMRTAAPAAGGRRQTAAPSFAALAADRESAAIPVMMGDQVVAILYADEGRPAGSPDAGGQTDSSQAGSPWIATLDVLVRHAARCLETITVFKAARASAESSAPAPFQGPGGGRALTGDHAHAPAHAAIQGVADASVQDGRMDDATAAQRYARLLVSEIKLYHEADVVAGRRDRDLMRRLGGEIARARVLYDQRVPSPVRLRTNYFQEELVRMLANGDESLLELRPYRPERRRDFTELRRES